MQQPYHDIVEEQQVHEGKMHSKAKQGLLRWQNHTGDIHPPSK